MFTGTTREEVNSYQTSRDLWHYASYGKLCRNYSYHLESTYKQVVVRKKRITTDTSGPYRPGVCKLTQVFLERIEDTEAKIDFFAPHAYPCHPWHFVGAYAPDAMRFQGGPNPAYLGVPVPNLSLDQELRMQAYSKLNSSGTGLSESLAEGGQVLSMVKSPLGGMAKILKHCIWDAKRGNFRTVKDASSAWLEYRYGWVPLYSTIKELLKPLKTSGLLDVAASDKSVSRSNTDYTWRFLVPNDKNMVSFFSASFSEMTETHRHRLYYRVMDGQLYAGFHQGSTFFQFPQIFWELVPLSFVVDWWYNVGDFIAAHTPNPSVAVLGETYSIKKVQKVTEHSREVATPRSKTNPLPLYGTHGANFTATREITSYLRLVPKDLTPIPVVPSFNAAFKSVKHAADALGLIIQRVPRRR